MSSPRRATLREGSTKRRQKSAPGRSRSRSPLRGHEETRLPDPIFFPSCETVHRLENSRNTPVVFPSISESRVIDSRPDISLAKRTRASWVVRSRKPRRTYAVAAARPRRTPLLRVSSGAEVYGPLGAVIEAAARQNVLRCRRRLLDVDPFRGRSVVDRVESAQKIPVLINVRQKRQKTR